MSRPSETTERFLREIAARIDPETIVEVHLFPAIRQGPMESGVAVIAADRPVAIVAEPADSIELEPVAESHSRLTIFRADYRHTVKGPDRGKWEIEVIPEADAPLETVDLVVRGVQKRVGEAIDADRMSGEQFRSALALAEHVSS